MPFFILLTTGLGLLMNCSLLKADPIMLMPVEGKMMVNAVVPDLDRQVFGLGFPETIGCREQMWLVNHPEAEIQWQIDENQGRVSTTWAKEGLIRYTLQLTPREDYVDVFMTIENLSDSTWHEVFAFNCVSPAKAAGFRDSSLTRTYLSVDQEAVALANLPRIKGPRPTVGVYPTQAHAERLPPFAQAFEATNPVLSDGSWMVVVSEAEDAYMATTTMHASFMFNNTAFGCIHAAPSFGQIAPHSKAVVNNRVYLSKGALHDFLERYDSYRMPMNGKKEVAKNPVQ